MEKNSRFFFSKFLSFRSEDSTRIFSMWAINFAHEKKIHRAIFMHERTVRENILEQKVLSDPELRFPGSSIATMRTPIHREGENGWNNVVQLRWWWQWHNGERGRPRGRHDVFSEDVQRSGNRFSTAFSALSTCTRDAFFLFSYNVSLPYRLNSSFFPTVLFFLQARLNAFSKFVAAVSIYICKIVDQNDKNERNTKVFVGCHVQHFFSSSSFFPRHRFRAIGKSNTLLQESTLYYDIYWFTYFSQNFQMENIECS